MRKKITGTVLAAAALLQLAIPQTAEACTTVLVGKDATVDGSTMIARNEDLMTAWTKRFYVREANSNPREFVSDGTGFAITLPEEQLKYTAVPEWDVSEGLYEEAGINSENIAMSATESATTKESVLEFDPLVEDGLAEDAMLTVVLPYIHSAREGVERLGELIEEYGTPEVNGVAFSDRDDVWYLETLTGHHWIAQRVPDDQYAVISNTLSIQEINWDDSENFMYSDGLKDFILDNKLAKEKEIDKINPREIFADTEDDDKYNLPRIMSGQNIMNPKDKKKLTDTDYDTFRQPDKPITLARVAFVLRDHFNHTEYDPYTGKKGGEFRPANLPNNMESHILHIRNDVPDEIRAIQWQALGVPDTSQYVPFYAGITETPEEYQIGSDELDTESAYWTYRLTNYLTVPYYADLKKDYTLPLRQSLRKELNEMLAETDKKAQELIKEDPDSLSDYLNERTKEFSDLSLKRYRELNNQLLEEHSQRNGVNSRAAEHDEDL